MTANPYQSPDAGASSSSDTAPPLPTPLAWKLVRSVVGVLTGVVVGVFAALIFEVMGYFVYPLPADFDTNNPQALKAFLDQAPPLAMACLAMAWTIGPLVGSFVAAAIARWAWFAHGMMIAAVFLALVVANVRSFPHPTWLVLVGVFGSLAAGWIGSSLAEWMFAPRIQEPKPDPKPYDMRKKNMAC